MPLLRREGCGLTVAVDFAETLDLLDLVVVTPLVFGIEDRDQHRTYCCTVMYTAVVHLRTTGARCWWSWVAALASVSLKMLSRLLCLCWCAGGIAVSFKLTPSAWVPVACDPVCLRRGLNDRCEREGKSDREAHPNSLFGR